MSSSSQHFIGWDLGSPDGDATVYGWIVGGRWVVCPSYIPYEWMGRIEPSWGPDRDGNMRWHLCWTGWNNGEGHAKVRRKGKAIYCHRDVVERVEERKLSRWNHVDHLCERKNCLTYECLEAVSPGENTRRGPGARHQFKPADAYKAPEPLPDITQRNYGDPLDAL